MDRRLPGIFGSLVNHQPTFGLHGPEDEKSAEAAFALTCELFMRHFGVTLGERAPAAGV